ncbi:putative phospho-N-acetylmuramoyl-pentapeptidetransferase MurX [Mycobacterium xenopi 3993]|nr:putative phospho-N-acetylmuramoyl-pentapeptidetransferase MurX [Mycobacterium xenopi 3993]
MADDRDPHRRRHFADGVHPFDPALIRLFTRQGFGHEIREDGLPPIAQNAARRRWAGWRS